MVAKQKTQLATFGAGCFWGVEETFRKTKGVVDTTVGYSGGKLKNPKYEDVCRDDTGHAEVVQVEYDPTLVSYEELLTIFFENHNPTQMNRQGPDVGTQYRSVIFYHMPEQKKAAEATKMRLNKEKFNGRIVTSIEAAQTFYRAEDYHQKFLMKRGLSSCHI